MKFDYSINKSNPSLYTIETNLHELKRHPGWSDSYLFRIKMDSQKVIIKPFWKSGVTSFMGMNMTDDVIRWHYARSRGNIQYFVWKDLMEFLRDDGGKIEYKKM